MVSTFLLLGLAADLGLSAAALDAGFLLAGLAEAAALDAGLSAAALVEAGFLLAGLSAAALVEAGLAAALVDLGFSASSSLVFLLAGALAGASSAARFCLKQDQRMRKGHVVSAFYRDVNDLTRWGVLAGGFTLEAGAFAGALVDSGLSAAFEAGFLALVLAGFLTGATGSSFLEGGGFEATREDRLGASAGSVDSVVFLGGILAESLVIVRW